MPQDCISEIHYPLAVADFKLPPAFVRASEANRTFSALLRQVTRGQTFTMLSHRRPVATLAAASATQGGRDGGLPPVPFGGADHPARQRGVPHLAA